MLAIKVSESGSAGMAETSVFQALSAGKTCLPPRLAFAPSAGHGSAVPAGPQPPRSASPVPARATAPAGTEMVFKNSRRLNPRRTVIGAVSWLRCCVVVFPRPHHPTHGDAFDDEPPGLTRRCSWWVARYGPQFAHACERDGRFFAGSVSRGRSTVGSAGLVKWKS